MSKAICLPYRDGEYIQTLLSFFFLIQRTQNINAEVLEWTEFGNANFWTGLRDHHYFRMCVNTWQDLRLSAAIFL